MHWYNFSSELIFLSVSFQSMLLLLNQFWLLEFFYQWKSLLVFVAMKIDLVFFKVLAFTNVDTENKVKRPSLFYLCDYFICFIQLQILIHGNINKPSESQNKFSKRWYSKNYLTLKNCWKVVLAKFYYLQANINVSILLTMSRSLPFFFVFLFFFVDETY